LNTPKAVNGVYRDSIFCVNLAAPKRASNFGSFRKPRRGQVRAPLRGKWGTGDRNLALGAQAVVQIRPTRRANPRKQVMRFLARPVQCPYADLKGDLEPMPRPQPSSTFIVPSSPAAPVAPRDAKPFVLVPGSFVAADDKLEPHWRTAIDAATD
jgi:hypothetical protein